MICPHGCKVKLARKPNGSWECPSCGCTFRLVVCYWQPKCFAKHHPDYGNEVVSLKEIRKKKKHKRKRKTR